MSVFSVTSIDRLIEPAPSSSRSSSMERESLSSTERRPPFSFYPPLYVTPPQQRPPSPSSFSPSPYVLNHKRRCPVQNGFDGAKATVGSETIDRRKESIPPISPSIDDKEQVQVTIPISMSALKLGKFTENSQKFCIKKVAEEENSGLADGKNGFFSAGRGCSLDNAAEVSRQQAESEVFDIEIMPEDCCENDHVLGVSTVGESGHNGSPRGDKRVGKKVNGKHRNNQPVGDGCEGSIASRTSEEFFDAPDSPFDDSATDDEAGLQNTTPRSPIKFEKMTPRLQQEIGRRIQAEETVASLQLQWNEMARRCSLIGLSLSSAPCKGGQSEEGEAAVLELFSEKLATARLVAGAIASAAVRAVKEEELESIVTTKNWEISRLRDKVQYYELVNHEMSQRNQEAIEIAQRRKRRRCKRQKWALGCFGATFCIATTGLLCHKFFPWEQARIWTKSLNCQAEPISTELAT